jgi:hypothetical protein
MSRPRPAFADDLAATLTEAFRLLARGVADRRSPLHTPVLASIGLDGAPRQRTLVLRGWQPATRRLRLHTDGRAAKVTELARDRRAALLAYDAAAGVQLRLDGTAELHAMDALAEAAWAGSRPTSRLCYGAAIAPGTPVEVPPPAPVSPDGRRNFIAIEFEVRRLEWLWLAAEGHRRAAFAWDPAGELAATWLAP